MKKFWTQAVLGAAALACIGTAHAALIDFENVDTTNAPFAPQLSDQDFVVQSGYAIGAYNPNNAGGPDGTLVGSLLNGGDPSNCLDGKCPLGNSTNYFAALNDGFAFISTGGGALVLNSFDAAFLAPAGLALPSTTVAYLAIEADRSNGSYAVGIFPLLGPTAGSTSFASFAAANAQYIGGTGTLDSGNVTALFAFAYYCDSTTGNCSAATSNKGQFALDNIAISVPEPSSWLLMTLGLGAVGALVRRRRSV